MDTESGSLVVDEIPESKKPRLGRPNKTVYQLKPNPAWPKKIEKDTIETIGCYVVKHREDGILVRLPRTELFRNHIDPDYEQINNLKKQVKAYIATRGRESEYGLFGNILMFFGVQKIALSAWGIYSKSEKIRAAQVLEQIVTCIDQFTIPSEKLLDNFRACEEFMQSGRLGILYKSINVSELKDCLFLAEQCKQLTTLKEEPKPDVKQIEAELSRLTSYSSRSAWSEIALRMDTRLQEAITTCLSPASITQDDQPTKALNSDGILAPVAVRPSSIDMAQLPFFASSCLEKGTLVSRFHQPLSAKTKQSDESAADSVRSFKPK